MTLAERLERLVPDLASTVLRFPLPVMLSVLLCIHLNVIGSDSDYDGRVILGASAAFMAAGAAHLMAEGRGLPRVTNWLLALVAAIASGLPGFLPDLFRTNPFFLFSGLLPILMIAPFLRGGVSQAAIWLFNLRFGLAALLASVVALLFAAGLSAIVEALNILFHAGIGNMHEHIWFTAMSLVAPLYGLSLMPRELNEELDIRPHSGSLLDRGSSVLVNYVAVPVIAIYALILHAYAVKILAEGELPQGQIGTMVSIFAIGGTAAWLVAWPWREQGTRLLRTFMLGWFFLLVVPAVLLTAAIWRRLADYGVTPDRYGVALVAVWVAALVFYLAIRRNRADMRVILGAVGVLLLLGSTGPMGANGLTIASQFNRLVALLESHGILKDGKIAAAGLLPGEAPSAGSSIIYALRDAGGLDRLKPWFENDPYTPFKPAESDWGITQALNEKLGFSLATVSPANVSFNANLAAQFDVPAGAKIVGPLQVMRVYGEQLQPERMAAIARDKLVLFRLNEQTYTIPQKYLLEEAKSRLAAKPSSQEPIDIEIAPGLIMLIDTMSGNLAGPEPLDNLRFWVIVLNKR